MSLLSFRSKTQDISLLDVSHVDVWSRDLLT